MTMTIEIKCANCPTTVQRACGADEKTSPWLCADCDPDEGAVAIEDDGAGFGSEQQLKDADEFNGELPNAPYIRHLESEDLLGDHFPDEPAKQVPDSPGGWFADDSDIGLPTRAQIRFAEKRLRRHGLGENQIRSQQDVQAVVKPILEGSEFQGGIQAHQFDGGVGSWMVDARDEVDAGGGDMDRCHPVCTREHLRFIPLWVLDDEKVRKVIRKIYPKQATNAKQRESAGRWLRIVYLYFRANQWVKTIAGTVGSTVRAVENVICRARKAGEEMYGAASSAVDTLEDTGKTASNEVVLQPIGPEADQAHPAPLDNSQKKQAA